MILQDYSTGGKFTEYHLPGHSWGGRLHGVRQQGIGRHRHESEKRKFGKRSHCEYVSVGRKGSAESKRSENTRFRTSRWSRRAKKSYPPWRAQDGGKFSEQNADAKDGRWQMTARTSVHGRHVRCPERRRNEGERSRCARHRAPRRKTLTLGTKADLVEHAHNAMAQEGFFSWPDDKVPPVPLHQAQPVKPGRVGHVSYKSRNCVIRSQTPSCSYRHQISWHWNEITKDGRILPQKTRTGKQSTSTGHPGARVSHIENTATRIDYTAQNRNGKEHCRTYSLLSFVSRKSDRERLRAQRTEMYQAHVEPTYEDLRGFSTGVSGRF